MIPAVVAVAARKRLLPRAIAAGTTLVLLVGIGAFTFLVILAGGGAQQTAEESARTNCAPQLGGGVVNVGNVPSVEGLDSEQEGNAATIAQVAQQLDVPDYGLVIALAVAWQESKLRNLDFGHADSLGLFQQRPVSGWGSAQQVTNPALAAQAFFGRALHTGNSGLLDVPGWQSLPLGVAAQSVQRSADPTGSWFAQHEMFARRLASRLAGSSGAGASITQAAASPQTSRSGDDEGPRHRLRIVHANIPGRSPDFPGAMASVVSSRPDLVSLNEMMGHSLRDIAPAGYDGWRAPRGSEPSQAMSTAVLWRTDHWQKVDAGRVTLVRNGPQKWDHRYANWVTVQDDKAGQVSMISAHHMVNPRKFGPSKKLRQRLYAAGMAQLEDLVRRLSDRGPVFLAGDMNSQFQHDDPWGPRSSLARVGMRSTMDDYGRAVTHVGGGSIDYVFYQPEAAKPLRDWTAAIPSDHRLVGADFLVERGGTAPVGSGVAGTMCGTAVAMDCPSTPWPEVEAGLTPDALRVLRCVHQQFPEVESYAGVGERDGNPGSSHGTGRAVDAMIPGHTTARGQTIGDRVADWVRQNARGLGVRYVIWDDRIWSVDRADEGWRPYSHPSGAIDATSAHRDHVHVDVFGSSAGADPSGPWATPVQQAYHLTSTFGECSSLWADCHTGLDFAAPEGTSVVAAASGTVVSAGEGGPYGNLVKVAHSNGVETWYAHLSATQVRPGTRVRAGQVIGLVGSTGNTTGPHLHFEVREAGVAVDPQGFLTARGVAA